MNAEDRQFEIARSLFREANDGFFLFDPKTQMVIDLNPAAQRLTGLEKPQACKLSLSDLFFSSGSGDLDRLALALNRTGFFHSREGYSLRRASSVPLPVNISVSRIHTEPEPVGLVVVRDISERNARSRRSSRQRLGTTAWSSQRVSLSGRSTTRGFWLPSARPSRRSRGGPAPTGSAAGSTN